MKQTAVEWLYEKLWKEFNFSFSNNILEFAKEIEKQQIIDAIAESNKSNNRNVSLNPEQYYNETFKK
jgi:hypothetical protein